MVPSDTPCGAQRATRTRGAQRRTMLARINHCPKHTSRARSSDAAIPPGRKNSRTPSRRGISTTRLPSPTGDTPVLQGRLDGEEHAGRLTVVALVDEGPRPASAERWSTCRFRRRRRRRSHRPPLEGGPDRGACGRAASWSAACAAAVRSLYAAVSPEPSPSLPRLAVVLRIWAVFGEWYACNLLSTKDRVL